MIRESLKNHYIGMSEHFRYRGEEPTRIETFSDAGFALAIGLLLISSSAPSTYEELITFTRDLLPFALCITLIMLVWFEHFKFFIRYGFRNGGIVVLNTLLMFLLLFYVYPLKFLTKLLVLIYTTLFSQLFGFESDLSVPFRDVISADEMPTLMVIYGAGAAGLFLTFVFMYRYALKRREQLELNEIEVFDTKESIYTNLLMASVPIISIILAIIIPSNITASMVAGFSYFLYFPVMMTFAIISDKKRKKMMARLEQSNEHSVDDHVSAIDDSMPEGQSLHE